MHLLANLNRFVIYGTGHSTFLTNFDLKKKTGFSFDLSQIFRKDCCCHSLTSNGGRAPWREMPVISRQIGLRHDRTSLDKKNPKKKMAQANTRLSSLEEPRSAKLTNDHVS